MDPSGLDYITYSGDDVLWQSQSSNWHGLWNSNVGEPIKIGYRRRNESRDVNQRYYTGEVQIYDQFGGGTRLLADLQGAISVYENNPNNIFKEYVVTGMLSAAERDATIRAVVVGSTKTTGQKMADLEAKETIERVARIVRHKIETGVYPRPDIIQDSGSYYNPEGLNPLLQGLRRDQLLDQHVAKYVPGFVPRPLTEDPGIVGQIGMPGGFFDRIILMGGGFTARPIQIEAPPAQGTVAITRSAPAPNRPNQGKQVPTPTTQPTAATSRLYDRLPAENGTGTWIGNRGDGLYRSTNPRIRQAVANGGAPPEFVDVEFSAGAPNFNPHVRSVHGVRAETNITLDIDATVGIDVRSNRDMAVADRWLAQTLNQRGVAGPNGRPWNQSDVSNFRTDNELTWHHHENMTTMQLVPTAINNLPHIGGRTLKDESVDPRLPRTRP